MKNYKILYEELLARYTLLQKDYSELEKFSQGYINAAAGEPDIFSPEDIDYIITGLGKFYSHSIKSIHATKNGIEETWKNPDYEVSIYSNYATRNSITYTPSYTTTQTNNYVKKWTL